MTIDELWEQMTALSGTPMMTSGRRYVNRQTPGNVFTYSVKGHELYIDRKAKPLTWATVKLALENAQAVEKAEGVVSGPKKLGVFGASYLYAIFAHLGVIKTGIGRPLSPVEGQIPMFEDMN
ncbi:MAG: hypothetical protein IJ242_10460 [Clostridia bacterium]|nr:hypothetical protein [Clostridia bacterium]